MELITSIEAVWKDGAIVSYIQLMLSVVYFSRSFPAHMIMSWKDLVVFLCVLVDI